MGTTRTRTLGWARATSAAFALCSCATLGGESNGGVNLPSAGDGPFRALQTGELAPAAVVPYVFGDLNASYRQPTVVGTTSDPANTEVWMYAVGHVGGADSIVRTHAQDARSFYADATDNANASPLHVPAVVLKVDQGWEGSAIGNPSALMVGGQVWLYYDGAGGIGLARSNDGLTFTKTGAPVLAPDATATWETTAPHAPAVAVFPDGTWHMLYGAGNSIGEATSSDGLAWTRSPGNPVLGPSAMVDPSTLAPGQTQPFDVGGVDDPVLAPQTTFDGRFQVRVFYTGYLDPPTATTRTSAIGLAGRFGSDGALSRQASPTYTAQLHERAAAFFEWDGGSMLYVGEDDISLGSTSPFPGIAAGYSPATGTLPPPLPFPTTP
ncbi:MAG TPA: hypothetical protein VIF09_22830 [Polyangiaceae bacterium]